MSIHPQDVTPTELRMPEILLYYKDATPTEFFKTSKNFVINFNSTTAF